MNKRELLFSVSIDDCEVQAFRGSGPGGQKRNKTSSAIRVIHHPSGARGEAREAREQHINKRNAFLRMVETKEFKVWHKLTTVRLCGQPSIEKLVDEAMKPENIKLEIKDDNGTWTQTTEVMQDE